MLCCGAVSRTVVPVFMCALVLTARTHDIYVIRKGSDNGTHDHARARRFLLAGAQRVAAQLEESVEQLHDLVPIPHMCQTTHHHCSTATARSRSKRPLTNHRKSGDTCGALARVRGHVTSIHSNGNPVHSLASFFCFFFFLVFCFSFFFLSLLLKIKLVVATLLLVAAAPHTHNL